jgi:hypothetical protein
MPILHFLLPTPAPHLVALQPTPCTCRYFTCLHNFSSPKGGRYSFDNTTVPFVFTFLFMAKSVVSLVVGGECGVQGVGFGVWGVID